MKPLFVSLVDLLDVMIKDKKMTKTYEIFMTKAMIGNSS